MNIVKPFKAESALISGCAVVAGSSDNAVAAPGAGGIGDYIGVYLYDPKQENKAAGDDVGIIVSGVASVIANGNVNAGKYAAITDDTGAFSEAGTGTQNVCGQFLESGGDGDIVEMLIVHGAAVIAGA